MASSAPLEDYSISNDVEMLTENEYSLSFVKVGENVRNGIIHWNVGKYHQLKNNMLYTCQIPTASTLCCPMWKFCLKKFSSFLRIGLRCQIEGARVTFCAILGNTTPSFVIAKGIEHETGNYFAEILCSAIEFSQEMLLNESLILRCQVLINDKEFERQAFPNRICSCTGFASDMEFLLTKKHFSNVVIEYGESVHEVHECIILQRCPKLHQLFSLRQDKNSNRLVFKPNQYLSENTYKEVLRYLYTGSTSRLSVDEAVSVFILSNNLKLYKLKEAIYYFLRGRVSKENFIRIALAAVISQCQNLKEVAKEFILRNKEEMLEYLYLDDGKTLNVSATIPKEKVQSLNELIKSACEQNGNPYQ